jgi:hypothetical protein
MPNRPLHTMIGVPLGAGFSACKYNNKNNLVLAVEVLGGGLGTALGAVDLGATRGLPLFGQG